MAETVTLVVVCTKCGCDIDYCSLCDREDCPAATCYTCAVVALHQ